MTITLKEKWEPKEVRRGITIMRRVAGTGTACGKWMVPGIYMPSMRAAREHIDGLPVGQFLGHCQIVNDAPEP